MILDKLTEFSDKQSVVGAVGTILSAKIVDTGAGKGDAGVGRRVYAVVRPVVAVASAGAATIDVQIQTSDIDTFASGVTTIGSTGPIPVAEFKNVAQALPRRCKRYVRLAYVIAGAATTAGTVDANLALDVDGVVRTDTGWKF